MAETPDCPCGSKLSDEEKVAINWGRDNPVFKNPLESAINETDAGFAGALKKAQSISNLLSSVGGGSNGNINTLINRISTFKNTLADYKNTSNRLSGLPYSGNGPDLLSTISTVTAAVNFQCALGIEGLNVGAGIGLMTENGKLNLNTSFNIQANLNKILDQVNISGVTLSSVLNGSIGKIQSEIDKISADILSVDTAINTSITEVDNLYNKGLDFVSQFTNINFAMNFSNDPCTKFGADFQAGIIDQQFMEKAKAANPLNKLVPSGTGTTTR